MSSKLTQPAKSFHKAKLQVKRGRAGLGLFTETAIKKGSFIIEYVGPLLTEQEADKKKGKYLFSLGKTWTIDGGVRANIARYINHACVRTNCRPIKYSLRIRFRATRDIKAGEELFYDYGKEYFDAFIGKYCRCPKHVKSSS